MAARIQHLRQAVACIAIAAATATLGACAQQVGHTCNLASASPVPVCDASSSPTYANSFDETLSEALRYGGNGP